MCFIFNARTTTSTQHVPSRQPATEKGVAPHMSNTSLFPSGNRVRVTSHGPFRGLNGVIRQIDSIVDDLDDPFCFYLIELERASIAEAIWF